jgi:hypothetical protein
MKKVTTFLIFISCTSFSIAQVAGYKGHRFIIGYSANGSPAFLSPLANTSFDVKDQDNSKFKAVGFNLTHGVHIDYVIKHATSFCVSAQVTKTGLAYKHDYQLPSYFRNAYGTGEISYRPSDNLPMQLNLTTLAAGFKFSRGYLAPVGKYIKLDVLYFMERVSFDPNALILTENPSKKYISPTDRYTFHNVGFGFSWGRQRVFLNRLVIDYGGRVGIIPSAIFRIAQMGGFFDEFSSSGNDELDYQIKRQALFRMQGSQLINFHIGIGFLAF